MRVRRCCRPCSPPSLVRLHPPWPPSAHWQLARLLLLLRLLRRAGRAVQECGGEGRTRGPAGAHLCTIHFLYLQATPPPSRLASFCCPHACLPACSLPSCRPRRRCCLSSECRLCPSWRPRRVHTPIWLPTPRNVHSSCRASWKTTDRGTRSTCNNFSASQTDSKPFSTSASMTCIRYTQHTGHASTQMRVHRDAWPALLLNRILSVFVLCLLSVLLLSLR
jgi:hypothetical protein